MNLKGWDIVSVTSMDHLNERIASQWEAISFHVEQEEIALEGTFGKWYFMQGGGGKILRLACPIEYGAFRSGDTEINLTGTKAVFNVMLNFSDKITRERKNADVNMLSLVLDCRKPIYISETGRVNSADEDFSGEVQPIDLIGCTSINRYIILNMLADCIIENQEKLQAYIFSEVQLRGNQGNWLSPMACRYSVIESTPPYIAIMAVCTNRSIQDLQLDVDTDGMDFTSGDSYFAISKSLVLQNVGVGCFTKMFVSSAEDYVVTDDTLSNIRQLSMPEITVGSLDYEPYIQSGEAQMGISGSQLHVDLKSGGCSLYAGIEMSWSSFNTFTCRYEDGNLKFSKDSSSFNHDEDIPWYLRFIPLSFIIDICVACISDSLADGIKVNVDIKDAVLNDIHWYGAGQNIKSAFLKDGLVISF